MKALKRVLSGYDRPALLIGNGPNLAAGIMPSWTDLLVAAGDKRIAFPYDELSNTEVYDLVELYAKPGTNVKDNVKQQLALKPSYDLSIHKKIMELAIAKECPVLTTNFDAGFETSIGAKYHHIESKGFTRYYPWKSYYAIDQLVKPCDGFGIWKIHGDVRYTDSIRLGLTDYIGSAERARELLKSGAGRLDNAHRKGPWQGHDTWLDIWFNKDVIIFGLGYGIDEVFLRWLLIERRRYFNKKGRKHMDVCYLTVGQPAPAINNLMDNLGVRVVYAKDFDEIYGL